MNMKILLLLLLTFTIKAQKSSNFIDEVIYKKDLTDPEKEKEIFLKRFGASKDECLASVDNTISIYKEKFGITIEKS